MAFFRKGRNANFIILNSFSWHVPGIGGLFAFLGWFIAGFLICQVISTLIIMVYGLSTGNASASGIIALAKDPKLLQIIQLVSYPFLFLPALIASRYMSNRNVFFENGYKVDSPVKEKINPWKAGVLCCLATFSLAFLMDFLNGLLPEMSDSWKTAIEAMVGGNFIINFICVSIFAPFFEEWFIRGTLLRGLLNCKRPDGSRGFSPFWSIVVTSAIFGLIHGNIWQALPAFALGCLFGYIYYKTGSLKLTMLMHFFNNTVSLVASQFFTDSAAETWADVIPYPQLYAVSAACLAVVVLVVLEFRKIKTARSGGCELIPAEVPSEVPRP